MNRIVFFVLIIFSFSCEQEKSNNYDLIQGLWVLDSSLVVASKKVYKEVFISPTESNRKIFAISEDRYYSYLKRSKYFVENDSSYFDYYLNSGSNYYIVNDTLNVHNTEIITNSANKMVLVEDNYSIKYQIVVLDSNVMQLKYFDVIHFYSLINREVKVENKNELLEYINSQ